VAIVRQIQSVFERDWPKSHDTFVP
jgi:hypothetical protein